MKLLQLSQSDEMTESSTNGNSKINTIWLPNQKTRCYYEQSRAKSGYEEF